MVSWRPLWMKSVLRKRKPVGERSSSSDNRGQTGIQPQGSLSQEYVFTRKTTLGQKALHSHSRLKFASLGLDRDPGGSAW